MTRVVLPGAALRRWRRPWRFGSHAKLLAEHRATDEHPTTRCHLCDLWITPDGSGHAVDCWAMRA